MLDHIVTAAEQKIPPQLALKLPPTSDAVVPSGRKDVVFWPQGGNSYSSTGVRSFSFRVSSDSAWLSTPSLMVALSVTETSSNANVLHCPAHSLIDRVTCRAAGTEISSCRAVPYRKAVNGVDARGYYRRPGDRSRSPGRWNVDSEKSVTKK